MDTDSLTAEALAYLAVTRLQADYADVVTRRAWDELDDLFTAGSNVHLNLVTQPGLDFAGKGEIGRFIGGSLEQFDFFEFVILNTVVRVQDENNATGRMYMCELRQYAAGGSWSEAYGIYHDRYERDAQDGRWRFADRDYQTLGRTGRHEVFPFPAQHAGPVA